MAIKIEGLKDLDKALSELKTYTARRVGGRAAESALEPVAMAARQLAPKTFRVAVGKKLTKRQAREVRSAAAEGKHVLTRYVGPWAPHAHLVEFGTVERFHKSGKSVGRMPPMPFMRPAWDGAGDQVLKILSEQLRVELDKAIARAAKSAARAAAKAGARG